MGGKQTETTIELQEVAYTVMVQTPKHQRPSGKSQINMLTYRFAEGGRLLAA